MDNNTFVSRMAGELGITDNQVSVLVEAFATVIKHEIPELNSIAIPSFGTFEPVKDDERVVRDLSSGQRLLLPPCITLRFNAATALKKRVLK